MQQSAAKIRNKVQHMIKGNIKKKRMKNHNKVMKINKGYWNWGSFENLIQMEINKHASNIIIVSEANISKSEQNIMVDYPKFYFESKFAIENDRARLRILINKDIIYKRLNMNMSITKFHQWY